VGSPTFRGKAVCYNSQDEAIKGIIGGEVKAGDVVVIRYEGPKGGPRYAGDVKPYTSTLWGWV